MITCVVADKLPIGWVGEVPVEPIVQLVLMSCAMSYLITWWCGCGAVTIDWWVDECSVENHSLCRCTRSRAIRWPVIIAACKPLAQNGVLLTSRKCNTAALCCPLSFFYARESVTLCCVNEKYEQEIIVSLNVSVDIFATSVFRPTFESVFCLATWFSCSICLFVFILSFLDHANDSSLRSYALDLLLLLLPNRPSYQLCLSLRANPLSYIFGENCNCEPAGPIQKCDVKILSSW
jgi:hypothetical protein